MGKVVLHQRESKPLPGVLLTMYRKRSVFTQNQLAITLGLKSDRMVQKWEGGYTLPTSEGLQMLVPLYRKRGVYFRSGRRSERTLANG
jgi:DNA-binding transcriptional regulator YiaG